MNTALEQAASKSLDDLKARVRSNHQRIRALLDEIVAVAGLAGDTLERRLTNPIWRLFALFCNHIDFEENELVPLLRSTGQWGTIRVEQLHEEHHSQRTVLLAMVDECDAKTKGAREIADDARWLVESLRKDMNHEDAELETIRDDGFVADQSTG